MTNQEHFSPLSCIFRLTSEDSGGRQLNTCRSGSVQHTTQGYNCRQRTIKTLQSRGFLYRYLTFLLFGLLLLAPVQCKNNTAAEESEGTTDQNYVKPSVESLTAANPDSDSLEPQIYNFTATSLSYSYCRKLMDNSKQVSYVCGEHLKLLPELLYAERLGKEVCEKAFKTEIWNCSGFSILKEPAITKGAVYKESTYVYTLSVAVIAHTIAQACSEGRLEHCNCTKGATHIDDSGTKIRKCNDSVSFGLKVAEDYLLLRYKGVDLKTDMVKHNIAAASKLVRAFLPDDGVECKCHGVSGSCTLKTCRSSLRDFQQVADMIKDKYEGSCLVDSNGQSQTEFISKDTRCQGIAETDLIYRTENRKNEDDINVWCQVEPSRGSVGTAGRECDPDPRNPGSCDKLCTECGRVSIKQSESFVIERDCRFEFCCAIKCDRYIEHKTYYYCSFDRDRSK